MIVAELYMILGEVIEQGCGDHIVYVGPPIVPGDEEPYQVVGIIGFMKVEPKPHESIMLTPIKMNEWGGF